MKTSFIYFLVFYENLVKGVSVSKKFIRDFGYKRTQRRHILDKVGFGCLYLMLQGVVDLNDQCVTREVVERFKDIMTPFICHLEDAAIIVGFYHANESRIFQRFCTS